MEHPQGRRLVACFDMVEIRVESSAVAWDLTFSLVVRALVGLFIALVFGAMGFTVGGMLWYPPLGQAYYIALPISGVGAGAGVGGWVGWLVPERGRTTILIMFGTALLGGLSGAWAGLEFARMTHNVVLPPGLQLEEVQLLLPQTARVWSVVGGALGSNVFPFIVEIVREVKANRRRRRLSIGRRSAQNDRMGYPSTRVSRKNGERHGL